MTNVDQAVFIAKAEIETWRDRVIRQIKAEHTAQMQVILERAKIDMQKGLDNALAAYQQSLENIQVQRKEIRDRSPEVAEYMKDVFVRSEASAKKMFESQVQFIKDMYKKGLGIS